MDIDLLSKMVKELILDDDKVVLPGLGCFVAEIVPAYFSDKGYTINPPYRKLYFRARPDEGDALILFYAKSNKVEFDLAEKIIKDFMAELKSVLHAKKTVVFPGLGRLRATKENTIFFVADEDLDIYPEGFGLEPISLKTHQETPEEVRAVVSGLKTALSVPSSDSVPPVESMPSVESTPSVESMPSVESTPSMTQKVDQVQVVAEPSEESELLTESEAAESETSACSQSIEDAEVQADSSAEDVTEAEEEVVAVESENVLAEVPSRHRFRKVLLTILVVLVVLLVAYMIVGRLCPDWIDQFLYTPEELEILNQSI